jgi:polygalacturonase
MDWTSLMLRFLPAFLLAVSLSAANSSTYNVLDYGARNDGSARSTEAIKKAIQAAAKAGGGTVYFPAGTYVTGAIQMVSNLVLHIDAGATLKFHTDLAEYPLVKGRYEGTEAITPSPLIGGEKLENITITGRGTLTTDNAEWIKRTNVPGARAMWESINERLEKHETVPESDYRKASPFLRPSFIRPMNSKNVLIEGVHIVGSSMWTLHILYCENVVIRNVVVETYPGHNTDGVDIDSSREVRISDSFFSTGDDAICIKSGKDADGRRVNRMTENVTITNCTIQRGHGAVVLGSETAGSIRNVVASNIVSQHTDKGVRIKSGRARGGVVENIRFDNWIIEDPAGAAIEVTNYYTKVPDEPVSARTPIFRNITISRMTVNRAPVAVSIEGLPEMPIEGLHLMDITATAKAGLRAFNTSALELHNVEINPGAGPAFLIRKSTGLEIDAIQSRLPTADPVLRLDDCPNAIIRDSRAWPGTDVFLSTQPGAKYILHEKDQLAAKNPTEEKTEDFWKGINSPDRPIKK